MSNTENADLELVAGLWITAKASNLFSDNDTCKMAWHIYEIEVKRIIHRYGYSQEQFGAKLVATASRLYTTQLKTEIFGYSKAVA